MNIKVIGGTPQHGVKSLCETCRNARVVKGFKESQTMVDCSVSNKFMFMNQRILFPVAECTLYDDKRIPTVGELQFQALVIDPNRVRVQGFTPKKD